LPGWFDGRVLGTALDAQRVRPRRPAEENNGRSSNRSSWIHRGQAEIFHPRPLNTHSHRGKRYRLESRTEPVMRPADHFTLFGCEVAGVVRRTSRSKNDSASADARMTPSRNRYDSAKCRIVVELDVADGKASRLRFLPGKARSPPFCRREVRGCPFSSPWQPCSGHRCRRTFSGRQPLPRALPTDPPWNQATRFPIGREGILVDWIVTARFKNPFRQNEDSNSTR